MATHRPRILVVGSANVDLTFRTARLPRPGETLAASGFHLGFGGKGANQAVAAARLGALVTLIARVGNDQFGQESLRRFQAEGLDTSFVRADADLPTGTAAIMVDDQGQNCILIVAGANAGLSAELVREAAPAFGSADVVLAQLEVPMDATLEAFRLARAAGTRTVLTPAPAQTLPDELLALCDLCIPNETEVEQLIGARVTSHAEAESAAATLRRRGAKAVIVTMGKRGALLLDERQAMHVPAVPVTAVDTTGAGDAFAAATAVFWASGVSLPEAAVRASTIAAVTVTRVGTQSAFPFLREVENAFL